MIKIKLIKLTDKFILVSDDYAKFGDYIHYNGEIEKVIYTDFITQMYSIYPGNRTPMCQHRDTTLWDKVIAGISELPQIDFSLLSEEDCKTIGWGDVEKLANNTIESYYGDKTAEIGSMARSYWETQIIGFIEGFKAAQSLNKEFSLEDMRKAILFGVNITVPISEFTNSEFNLVEKFIQSLQQTIWDVEIEVECGEARQCECIGNINCLKPQSKITNNSIKITKIL